ncbi:MAG: class I SAM-dependent methyltransferase [Anaerolineae bacterium]
MLDVGSGTGALARPALEQGAAEVVQGDISGYMFREAAAKNAVGTGLQRFCQLDAEALPFADNSFDAVMTGMSFGLFPDQAQAVAEMRRVARPGGLVCAGIHGSEHYWEPIDACFRCLNKRYILGYRLEWWPRTEKYIIKLAEKAGLEGITSKRVIWRNDFGSGSAGFDYFFHLGSILVQVPAWRAGGRGCACPPVF